MTIGMPEIASCHIRIQFNSAYQDNISMPVTNCHFAHNQAENRSSPSAAAHTQHGIIYTTDLTISPKA